MGGEQLLLITPESAWQRVSELPDLRRCPRIGLDRETRDDGLAAGAPPGWPTGAGFVCGVSVAWRDVSQVRAAYLPVRHPDSECFDADAVRRWEIDHQRAGVRFAMQNGPYDVGWGEAGLGVPVPERVDDATCMAVMIDENRLSYDLDAIARWRGTPGKSDRVLREAAAAYGRDPMRDLWRLPARYVGEYAESDAVAALLAVEDMERDIRAQGLEEAYATEMALLPVVHAMRRRGIRVDVDAAERAYVKFKRQSEETLRELSSKLSHTATVEDIRRTEFLEKIHDAHGVKYPTAPLRRNGKIVPGVFRGSFDKRWMARHEHWLPRLLIRAKSRDEAAEKFVRNYILEHQVGGRIHANVNQFLSEDGGTRTHRFSYSGPPLQQMPFRDEDVAREVRGCFVAEDGEEWADADYSQQEFRLDVHYAVRLRLAKAREVAEEYRRNPKTDFHAVVARWTGLERKPAKDANFAKSYGAGLGKFAAMIGKSAAEAAKIMQQYDAELPFMSQLFNLAKRQADARGYIRLLDGARIHFDTWEPTYRERGTPNVAPMRREHAERAVQDPEHPWYRKKLRRAKTRNAMNCLIQGGAARQTKTAMVACWRAGLLPILQVHDELCFSVSSRRQCDLIRETMEGAVQLDVPMVVDVGVGRSWAEAK